MKYLIAAALLGLAACAEPAPPVDTRPEAVAEGRSCAFWVLEEIVSAHQTDTHIEPIDLSLACYERCSKSDNPEVCQASLGRELDKLNNGL